MKFWVGVTDNDWFKFLAARKLDEVNFWQPSSRPLFSDAPTGLPFLFKLKRPHNHIAGGGFYVAHTTLPVTLAWEIFGEKNGAASFDQLQSLLGPLRQHQAATNEIGCTVLSSPFFFPQSEWIKDPAGWAQNIVRGKMYDDSTTDARAIWNDLQPRLAAALNNAPAGGPLDGLRVEEPVQKFGTPLLFKPRLGQASFRVLVTDAYKRRCAITGENTLVALEAAHIVPYASDGSSHDIRNGLLLRADFHRLFDAGLVSITPEMKIKVSRRIRETWFNGKVYYRLNDQPLSAVPDSIAQRPDPDRLNWHYNNVFQA
ncbi:MAG: HNH endonuclease [Metallibacterium scheffleri]|jgi:putative restriction endonuclease|uniref:HNH nuclease domain-containing protein n=1 Tax=Metallibacterium scheffleri TaxID=993689 RepID=A0A4S3KHY3_9GAMM|nr:HNH endonuclease [Metallibacterium scheffleri]MCK9367040.1 HNH endonuclease [Metallibacterium scheffleri]THD08209.1 hypothetical protein B1806_13450 [Metallibacterium scheffleri]